MEIVIKIPKEFEEEFGKDCFCDTLQRLSADAHSLAGNYEQETAAMLAEALKNAAVLPKGHGRIIDEDKVEWEPIWDESVPGHKSCVGYTAVTDKTPTVLEADREDENANSD